MLNVRIITIMPKKLTTEEWINKARIKHGDKYDYSKVKYNGTRGYVTIVCPKHGEFWQTPNSHIQGSSCSSSKGEEEVCNILLSNGIKFIREYTIQVPNEINTSGHAYIDFYLPEYNTFVEYNGIIILKWHLAGLSNLSDNKLVTSMLGNIVKTIISN